MEIIGFIGLGQMGAAMAANLQKAGYGLRVYNRNSEKTKPFVEKGATKAETAADAAQHEAVIGNGRQKRRADAFGKSGA